MSSIRLEPPQRDVLFRLQCDGWCNYVDPVTSIDEKGYAYRSSCAAIRRRDGYHRVRRLQTWEIRRLCEGKGLLQYAPMTREECRNRELAALASTSVPAIDCAGRRVEVEPESPAPERADLLTKKFTTMRGLNVTLDGPWLVRIDQMDLMVVCKA